MYQDYLRDTVVLYNLQMIHALYRKRGTMWKIGLAKQLGGLYYLKPKHVNSSVSAHLISTDNSRLWHLRLGHLSYERIKCMNKR